MSSDNPPYVTVQLGPCDTLYRIAVMIYDPIGDGYIIGQTLGEFSVESVAAKSAETYAAQKGFEFRYAPH